MRARTFLLMLVLAVVVAIPATAQRRGHGGHGRHGRYVGWTGGYWGSWWGPGWASGWAQPYPARTYLNPDLAVVDTDIEPEHARVYLNGELIGTADDFDGLPDYLYLEEGEYKLEFRLPGYKTEVVEIDSSAGRFFPLDFELVRAAGEKEAPWFDRPDNLPTGRVFGPKGRGDVDRARRGADVRLRREVRDRVEDVKPEKSEVDDEEESEVEDEGDETKQEVIVKREVEKSETGDNAEKVIVEKVVNGAALKLDITPRKAAVYVDGELVGSGEELARLERGLAVSPGNHKVEVFAPGHLAKVFEVEVGKGEKRQLVVELDKQGVDKSD